MTIYTSTLQAIICLLNFHWSSPSAKSCTKCVLQCQEDHAEDISCQYCSFNLSLLFCTHFYVPHLKYSNFHCTITVFFFCCNSADVVPAPFRRAVLLNSYDVIMIFLLLVLPFPGLNACNPGFFSLKPMRRKQRKRSLLPPLSHWL